MHAQQEAVTIADDAAGAGSDVRSAVIEHAAAQAALQPWVAMECYQLSRGKLLSQMDSLDLGQLQIVRESQFAGIQKLGATPADFCTISYCTQDPAFRFSDHAANDASSIFFMPEQTEFDIYVPAGTQTTYIGFSQQEFVEAAQALRPGMWQQPPRQLSLFQSPDQPALNQALTCWLKATRAAAKRGEVPDPAVMRGLVLQTVLRIVTAPPGDEAMPVPRAARSRALRICRLARDYVEQRLAAHAVPTIVDICVALAVSERTLLYAFHDYVGMSPQTYLRRCRLNQVRAILLAGDPQTVTVTQAAMQLGFLHLGRFAGDYRQVFEETPTATLARAS